MTSEELAEVGTCKTCGQQLIKWKGDIWHPHDCGPCPASLYGRPGEDNWLFDPEATRRLRGETNGTNGS